MELQRATARQFYWMYGLVLRESTALDAAGLAPRLRGLGVETRPFFLGMHEQPVFHKRGLFWGEKYPGTARIARQGLYLPSGLALDDAQLDGGVPGFGDYSREHGASDR